MSKPLQTALESVQQMNRVPKYIIVPQPDGTCQIVRRDHEGVDERFYRGLTHMQAGGLADVLNVYASYEFGYGE